MDDKTRAQRLLAMCDGGEAYQQGYPITACPVEEGEDRAAWITWRGEWLKAMQFDDNVKAEYGQE